jgi:hypothetical protein
VKTHLSTSVARLIRPRGTSRARVAIVCGIGLVASTALAQDAMIADGPKRATAVRTDQVLHLDGRLEELAWQSAPAIADFVQKEPTEGALPSERTEVRFLYDERSLFVGARMYSSNANAIQAPLGRRDEGTAQSEHIIVSLDTLFDRRTAYSFGVTASGVRIDRYYGSDNHETFDSTFDPVWQARTSIDESGWTAELWIPFSQLRFSRDVDQVWGLNLERFIPTHEEDVYWVAVPRTERVWASRFGELHGIRAIPSTRRVELAPFLVGSALFNANAAPGNPFLNGRDFRGRVGLDLKMGLGPSLTMQMTVNPDFGQVEADPAEVNLTANPTRFSERRPFFTEGSRLLNPGDATFFYSRRIGAPPTGPAAGDFVDYPRDSTILGAVKVTGRLRARTSLGVLGAVTGEEFARTADAGVPEIRNVRVGPSTGYGVFRVQQEFGQLGSTASVLVVGTRRWLPSNDALAERVASSSLAAFGDALLRFAGGEYELAVTGGPTIVRGEPAAIERIQRSSVHYAHRPDRERARLDPELTSLSGFTFWPRFSRVSGRHWLWSVGTKFDSPRFNPNEFGLINAADGIEHTATVRYRETLPGKVFRNYSVAFRSFAEMNWEGNRQSHTLTPSANVTWRNFWTSSASVTMSLRATSAYLTRGGPLMQTPRGWSSSISTSNALTARTRWSWTLSASGDEAGGMSRRLQGSLSFRPTLRWQLSITPSYDRSVSTQQYVTTRSGGPPETFGNRYVFARIERHTLATQFRMNYTLKADVNLDVYAEPFAASGRYSDFGELAVPATRLRLTYGTAGTGLRVEPDGTLVITTADSTFTLSNPDFNTRSFRSNVVLRWEWKPGSTLYVVWQQDRQAREAVGSPVGVGDMFGSLREPGINILLVKTSFWLPVP